MEPEKLLIHILLGGIFGVLGQGIRTITGLKKVYDEAASDNQTFAQQFVPSLFIMSLFIGFVAGALAMVATSEENGNWTPSKQAMLGLIAAGYSGTDFIEGFMKKYLPQQEEKPAGKTVNLAQQGGG